MYLCKTKRTQININKQLIMSKVKVQSHLVDRFKSRITDMPIDAIDEATKTEILTNLNKVLEMELEGNQSFGIKLKTIEVDKRCSVRNTVNGRRYMRVNDFLGHDSTGDEIWVIVRENKLQTIMLRKGIQPTAKLNVTNIISL